MAKRLVSVDENNNLPPEVQTALVGGVKTLFEDLTASAESAATTAGAAASVSADAATTAAAAASAAQEAAQTAVAPTDSMVASLVDSVSVTRVSLDGRYGQTYTPQAYGAAGDGVADDTAAFNAMFAAIPEGAVVECPPAATYKITSQLNLTKPVTVRGGNFMAAPAGTTFMLQAPDIMLEDMTIKGTNAGWPLAPLSGHYFISSNGTTSARHSGHQINNVAMQYCRGDFIRLYWPRNFRITNCTIQNGQYAGIMLLSAGNGLVQGNTVLTLLQGGTLVNSYGIAVSDDENTSAARSKYVVIDSNYIEGVKDWEGIDTHGGFGITVTNNTVVSCRTPIAITTGNSTRLMPPEQCYVGGNTVVKGSANSETAGIVFNGKAPDKYCTGGIGVNNITGFAVEMIVDYTKPLEMSIAAQATNVPLAQTRGPSPQPYRIWTARGTLIVPANASSVATPVAYPAGLFTGTPVVMVTKASGTGARYVPYTTDSTATGVTVGVLDPTGTVSGSAVSIPYDILVIQSNSGTTGRGIPYA